MAERAPITWRNIPEHLRIIAGILNSVLDGRQNNVGTVTLTASVASTSVAERRCGTDSVITLMPTTGNAAAELGNGTLYIGTVTAESFTITHANNAQTDRTFKYEVTG